MSETNGSNGQGTPEKASYSFLKTTELPENALYAATEIWLKNGLRVWVYQESQTDHRRLIKEWHESHPPPDKKLYERPVPEDEATIPGQMLSAESNPEYKEVLLARMRTINDYVVRALILGYTDFPDFSEAELITKFERVIARKRKAMQIPDDPWEATLFHGILQTEEEQQQIVNAVEKKLAVEFEEVIDSVAIFRPVHKRNTDREVPDAGNEPLRPEASTGLQSG